MGTTRTIVFLLLVGNGALLVTGCSRGRSAMCCDPCAPGAAPRAASLFKPRPSGKHPKRKPLPASVVGTWRLGNLSFEFKKDGRYYLGGAPVKWSVSADGTTLTYHTTTYKRTSGKGRTLHGTWYSKKDGEELYFRTDGSYTSHWADNQDYGGTWNTAGALVTMSELRAIVSVNGASMTFSPMYATDQRCSWRVKGKQLVLTCNGKTTVLTRV
jgi:hypothetical protein